MLPGVLFLTKDSLDYSIPDEKDSLSYDLARPVWRFIAGDLPNGAGIALDDGRWPLLDSRLHVEHDTAPGGFGGIAWMRLHFVLDSSLAGMPLVLRIRQAGASELYLDGRLLHRYGIPAPRDSAAYYDPKEEPLNMPFMTAGPHVLAVRYANWDYLRNQSGFHENDAGFRASIWEAGAATRDHTGYYISDVTFCTWMFGVFITLSLLHLILYLYYRADPANGRFSLFAACIGLLFLMPVLSAMSNDAAFTSSLEALKDYLILGLALSLSFLLNGLFCRQKWHFYTVAACCGAAALLLVFFPAYWNYILGIICLIVPVEAVLILVSAFRRKLPGAHILGFGLMLLMVVMLLMIVLSNLTEMNDAIERVYDLLGILFVLVVVSLPISISMYLAWRFATVNRNLKAQLQQVELLSARAREQEAEKQRLLETRQEELEREVAARTEEVRRQNADLVIAKQKSDDLLLNILPGEIADELKETGKSEARLYNEVSVLFTDFVGFTQVSEHLSPTALVAEIDFCFKAFDGIITAQGLEKIKTVGDAYIAVSGLPLADPEHAKKVVAAGLEIRAFMQLRKESYPGSFEIRLGIHSGPVVAGIVGVKKFAYDIWGDTVNTAARMEQYSEPGRLNISGATYELVRDHFRCTLRGELEVKNKGKMKMYFVG
jgi:class 3 adenylate cyclase